MRALILLFLSIPAWAVPTVSISNSTLVLSGQTITFAHTCAVGDNVSLNVIIGGLSSVTVSNLATVTFRGVTSGANVALSLNPFNANIGNIEPIQTFHLLGCPSGLAGTIVVTYEGNICAAVCSVQALAVSINNTDFTNPITSIIGSQGRILSGTCASPQSIALTSAANDIVIALITGNGDTTFSGMAISGGGTVVEQFNNMGGGNSIAAGYTSALTAGAHTLSWNTNCTDFRGYLAVSIKQFAAYPIMSGTLVRPGSFLQPIAKQTALVSYAPTMGDTNIPGWGLASLGAGSFNGASVFVNSNDGADDGTRCTADYGVCIFQLTDFTAGTPTFANGPNMTGYGANGGSGCAGGAPGTHNRTRMPYIFKSKLYVTGGCTDVMNQWTDTRIWVIPNGINSCNWKTWQACGNACNAGCPWSSTGDKPTDSAGFQWPAASDPTALLVSLTPVSMGCQDFADTCAIAPGLDPAYVYYFGAVIARHLKSAADPMDPTIYTFRRSDGSWTGTLALAETFTQQFGGNQTMNWDKYHGVFIGMSDQFHGIATAPLPWGPWTNKLPATSDDYQFQGLITPLLTVTAGKVTAVISLNGPGSHDPRLESLDLGPVTPIRAY